MIYLFDIDGTLTKPRESISSEFEEFFYKWSLNKKIYLVTGSDRNKVKEQLSDRIIKNASGIFCSMANELYIPSFAGDKDVYSNRLHVPDRLIAWLEQQIQYTEYPEKTGNHIEYRAGMINFSIPGRNSTKDQRQNYYAWDLVNGERVRIANYIQRKFPELEARIGGQISIDIQELGKNKSQAAEWLRKNNPDRMHFFGDRCSEGGNDYDIVKNLIDNGDGDFTNVEGPEELHNTLQKIG